MAATNAGRRSETVRGGVPLGARAAMVAIGGLDRPATREMIDAVLSALSDRPEVRADWWVTPNKGFEGQRPSKLLAKGQAEKLLLGVTAMVLQVLVQLRADGGAAAAEVAGGIMIERLETAGAPLSIINEVRAMSATASRILEEVANDG